MLGGAIAPIDATAVGVLARALPRRNVTVLRAESLVNDGTVLVIYFLAVGVAVRTEPPHCPARDVAAGPGVLSLARDPWCSSQVGSHR